MSKQDTFKIISGMKDILPEEQPLWHSIIDTASSVASFYNFYKIDTPILEFSDVFKKGTGESTDIVQKEMFSFKTKGNDDVTLKPEGTPPVIRSYIENGMDRLIHPVKLFYCDVMFRYEKPQKGRKRQFHQFGVECIGEADPIRDVQVIQFFFSFFDEMKIGNCMLEINTLGCSECMQIFKNKLKSYYENNINQLCVDCRQRYKGNLLRLLDCKDEKCYRLKHASPQVLDFICEDCSTHFQKVLSFLDVLNIPYMPNPHLVRGLDYYNGTVFEIFKINEKSDKNYEMSNSVALASGGRYDGLVEILGGKENTPAVGGAMGIERIIDCIDFEKRKKEFEMDIPKVFIVQLGEKAKEKSLFLIEDFRKEGIRVAEALGRNSMTTQLNVANRMGCLYSIIIGQKEVIDDVVLIRDMKVGSQEKVDTPKVTKEVKRLLGV